MGHFFYHAEINPLVCTTVGVLKSSSWKGFNKIKNSRKEILWKTETEAEKINWLSKINSIKMHFARSLHQKNSGTGFKIHGANNSSYQLKPLKLLQYSLQ